MKNTALTYPTSSLRSRMHSKLAMKAAKKMGRTKSKQKTGRKVFHHLKMMIQLQSDPSKNWPRRVQSSPFVQNLLVFPGDPRD
ncbi:hypothetical protein OA067_06995 [Gammaproteobacteria bacterium]|nr:hypothetical protein [Gammaproteobacteria bacterium]